jgi:hypothetical protein
MSGSIAIRPEECAAFGLPPASIHLDVGDAPLSVRRFPGGIRYLTASGPVGNTILFTLAASLETEASGAAIERAVRALFTMPGELPVEVGPPGRVSTAGAVRPALAFTTGSGYGRTSWCATLVPESRVFVTFGRGPLSSGFLTCEQLGADPAFAPLLRTLSFSSEAGAPAASTAHRITADQSVRRGLPPIDLEVVTAGTSMRLSPPPDASTFLMASGPPGPPLMFIVSQARERSTTPEAIANAVQAAFRQPWQQPIVMGTKSAISIGGTDHPAQSFVTGKGNTRIAWGAALIDHRETSLLVTFGHWLRQEGIPTPAEVASHPELSVLVSSFRAHS